MEQDVLASKVWSPGHLNIILTELCKNTETSTQDIVFTLIPPKSQKTNRARLRLFAFFFSSGIVSRGDLTMAQVTIPSAPLVM